MGKTGIKIIFFLNNLKFNMQNIFSSDADYTGISHSTLELSAIIQHASINVTEAGAGGYRASGYFVIK